MRTILIICLSTLLWSPDASTAQETTFQQPNPESASAQQNAALPPRLLIIDYAMAYPQENAGMIRAFAEAGLDVDYRPYYPALVERDAAAYDAILLLGGGDPGMSIQDLNLAINFVTRGKVLILAMPSDGPYGERRKNNPGVHDRYQFNEVLSRLNINLYALNADHRASPLLNPYVSFEPAASHSVGRDLDGSVFARAGTRLLVGDGAEPLLVEAGPPEAPEPGDVPEEAPPEEEPEYRIVRRTLRIQPADALAGEDIELLLRGSQELRADLYYRNRESPSPVDWTTARFKGEVEGVSEAKDTLTVRMPGNRWGSEYALVSVPAGVVAAAFAGREIREEIRSVEDLEAMRENEEIAGRLAVAAAGRTDRLGKGYVVAVDRDVLTGLDRPLPPLGMGPSDPDRESLGLFLGGFARYVRGFIDAPEAWSPEHDYPLAQMPGNQKPDISLNNVSIQTVLPERVRVIGEATSGPLAGSGAVDAVNVAPLRGVWDFIARRHEHVSDLAGILPGLGLDFLWTVAPAASYTGGTQTTGDVRFESWALPILNRLGGTSTGWYAGISAPRDNEITGEYVDALNARGDPVGLPSRLDMAYLNRYLFEPARDIARHSRGQSALKAIVHDWEPHITRSFDAYAATDIFDDLHFPYFIRHLVRNGLYHGDEFTSLMGLDRDERFEWLLKSGHLETYIQLQETNAERLGTLYRQSMDEINPGLLHGAFVRSLRPNWYHLGFWRGVGTPERPFLVFSYERPPEWYARFLSDNGISARVIPVGLLGFIGEEAADDLLQTAAGRGGYALERGIWLVTDPPEEAGLNVPRQDLTRDALLDAIRSAAGN